VTRLISLQVALNERYAQRRVEMYPTLSPVNLLPAAKEIDKAVTWGRQQIEKDIPYVEKFLERVRWLP
jgi:hypothetical protein